MLPEQHKKGSFIDLPKSLQWGEIMFMLLHRLIIHFPQKDSCGKPVSLPQPAKVCRFIYQSVLQPDKVPLHQPGCVATTECHSIYQCVSQSESAAPSTRECRILNQRRSTLVQLEETT
eukprot:scaffold49356_cov23-Tisochrysis_lutea.AAC.1